MRQGRLRMALAGFAALLALGAAISAAGCGGSSQAATTGPTRAAAAQDGATGGSHGGAVTLNLVAYSTPKEAYAKLIPAFQRTPAGKGVGFHESYGSSGEQSRAVEAGLPADVVEFSLEPDMTRLVDAGIVGRDWNTGPHRGIVTDSVVVFVVRKGNPKHIRTWDDLVKPGVEVITPNPFTSGGARWNLMAAYGAQLALGRSKAEAVDYLRRLLEHTSVQDKSARESLQTFLGGKGDVMLAYENEALLAEREGADVEHLVPDQTILIENPIAVTKTAPPAAKAFVDFLFTPQAQRIFGEEGYRPVLPDVAASFSFPTPQKLFTIADLGGWSKVSDAFFDREHGIVAEIERDLGVPTEG